MLSANDERDDQQAFVYAVGPDGHHPGHAAADERPGARHRQHHASDQRQEHVLDPAELSVRERREPRRRRHDAGQRRRRRSSITSSRSPTRSRRSSRPTLLNQFQMLFGHEREPTTSLTPDRGIVVAGAFTGGGAQADLVRTETHINLNESLAWTHGHHLRAGRLPAARLEPARVLRSTNFGGTFYFASLDAYAPGRPYAFTQQQGNGDLAFLEKQVGAYIKDDWQVRPGLSIGSASATTGRTTFTTTTTSRRASRSPTRRATGRRTSSAPASASSTIAAARW